MKNGSISRTSASKVLKNSSQPNLEEYSTKATELQSSKAIESLEKFIDKIMKKQFKSAEEKKLTLAKKKVSADLPNP